MATSEAPPPSGAAPQQIFHHTPVLLEEVLGLAPPNPGLVADVTLGGGGHAEALLRRFPAADLFGCDRDPAAVRAAKTYLAPFGARVLCKQLPFADLRRNLLSESVDFLLADLGVSSHQLDLPGRGFSFSADGPLDMRMDPTSQDATAADLVNGAEKSRLLDILYRLGEERFAPRIVNAILAARPIAGTRQLAQLAAAAVPRRFHRKGLHPATKVFQALRMAVNDEVGQLEALLDQALGLLKPGGRIVVISFHSLEDRPVKTRFRDWEQPCKCPSTLPRCVCGKTPLGKRLTRKPVMASEPETRANPRARSAKLRGFEKS